MTDDAKVGPWWEDDEQVRDFLFGLDVRQGPIQIAIIRAAARRAVETHGHARGCECHSIEECASHGWCAGEFDSAGRLRGRPYRDPHCAEGAK